MALDFSKVVKAVEVRDWKGAILALRGVWAENKHPMVAELFEALYLRIEGKPVLGGKKKAEHEGWLRLAESMDPVWMAGLVASHAGGDSGQAVDRLRVLEKWGDAMVLSGVVRGLAAPGYRAGSAAQYFSRVSELLASSGATHFLPELCDIIMQYPTIIPTTYGETYQKRLRSAVKKLEKLGPVVDPGIPARLWELLKDEVGEVRAKKGRVKSDKVTEAELLAAVFASPGEDGPRLVYADFLSGRGDIRGEFISVQVQRAVQDAPDLAARERELWAELGRVAPSRGTGMVNAAMEYLAGDLVGLSYQVVMERGFPARAVLSGNIREYIGSDAWATVHSVNCKWVNARDLAELVTHPVMRSLDSLIEVSDEQLAAIWAIRPLKLKRLRLSSKNISEQVRVLLESCPPEQLLLGGFGYSMSTEERL